MKLIYGEEARFFLTESIRRVSNCISELASERLDYALDWQALDIDESIACVKSILRKEENLDKALEWLGELHVGVNGSYNKLDLLLIEHDNRFTTLNSSYNKENPSITFFDLLVVYNQSVSIANDIYKELREQGKSYYNQKTGYRFDE